jgi:hypothetical protein
MDLDHFASDHRGSLCRCRLRPVRSEATKAGQGKPDAAQRPADKRRGEGAK